MKKIDQHIFGGMQRDLSISKQKPEFLWDAHNIRLTAREGDTMLSITNEKGTSKIDNVSFAGKFLGYCVLDNYLVVFTADVNNNIDYIYRIDKNNNYKQETLFSGNLGFNTEHPIETLGVYENEFIQKVYWVDGFNQPRVINITKNTLLGKTIDEVRDSYNSSSFDFVQELRLKEVVTVTKESSSSGMFPAGTIQYAISYYNKYGQESNIAYVTPLFYTSYPNRAGSPEDRLGNAFKITVSNVDNNFDYLRIYSIFRTSRDAVPTVKRVVDLELKSISNALTIRDAKTGWFFTAQVKEAIQINTDNGSGWISIAAPTCPVKPENFTTNAHVFNDTDSYYVFKKSKYPYLLIRDSYTGYYYTWGDATEIIINVNKKVGPSGNTYYIIGNDNPLVRASYADYGEATNGLSYVDNGQSGDTIDPTQLLYIGGEDIIAGTITAKDGTLFLGNISINRKAPSSMIGKTDYKDKVTCGTRIINLRDSIKSGHYNYYNTLNARATDDYGALQSYNINASGFKSRERYRLGVQFQYKNGKWSEPVFIDDVTQKETPSMNDNLLFMPKFKLSADFSNLLNLGYKRVRPIVVFPTLQERRVIAQGLLAPTVYSIQGRENGTPYAQSSWFFRLNGKSAIQNKHGYTLYGGLSKYTEIQGVPKELSGIKVSDIKSSGNTIYIGPKDDQHIDVKKEQMSSIFAVDQNIVTMHSPDLEFDDTMQSINYGDFKLRLVGKAAFNYDMGDIDIETSSPTISHEATGFVHHTYNGAATSQLCAGLFYDDYLVDDYDKDDPTKFEAYSRQNHSFLFMVYPWNKSGSLNNDIVRPNNGGSRSSVLKRKKISNLKFSQSTDYNEDYEEHPEYYTTPYDINVQIFNSDQMQLIKVNGYSYYGNVDTMIAPVVPCGSIFATGEGDNIPTFNSTDLYIQTKYATCVPSNNTSGYQSVTTDLGDYTGSLRVTKEAIRMKYKSSPHFVFELNNNTYTTLPYNNNTDSSPWLWMGEIYREGNEDLMFGGTTEDALKANLWFPCGESVEINSGTTNIEWKYGDTWYERYDCLKTYPFTMEDENSIVEIASFMCETRVNIDGRYDKNRGQDSNLFMTPQNFNLINNVYSQYDSFFNYRLLDNDYYALNNFPASIMWSLQKQSASIVDNWTNITMANMLDLDGSKGSVNALKVWNDNIYCFQDTGISNILFNSRVQIPTSDNVPIEISNNYKVDGERYISNNLGCKNKWSICVTESGIYFIDSISNSLYNLGNSMTDISSTHGFSHWFDEQLSQVDNTSSNQFYLEKTFYDKNMNDLYITTKDTALCFSELLGQFTSFMSYKNPDAMFNIGSDFYTIKDNKLWKMFAGGYNNFFGNYEPFDITFISNNDSAEDKIFTNIELRADFYADDTLLHNNSFNYIRAWNEYQDTGKVKLDYTMCKPSNLKKKFRIWRIDIPRDKTHKLDRIRNTWTKIQLGSYSNDEFTKSGISKDVIENIKKSNMELHDLSVDYFI